MVTARVISVFVALTALAACTDGVRPDAQSTTTAQHAAAEAPTPLTTNTSIPDAGDAIVERYNPTHDPGTCVRLLSNGQVALVKILLVPGQPKPAYVNGAKCG